MTNEEERDTDPPTAPAPAPFSDRICPQCGDRMVPVLCGWRCSKSCCLHYVPAISLGGKKAGS